MKNKQKRKKATVITSPLLLWINRVGEALNWAACGIWFFVAVYVSFAAGGRGLLPVVSTVAMHGALALALRHMRAM